MLVLSRKHNERCIFTLPDGRRGEMVIVEIRGDKVRLGFQLPEDVAVNRSEVQSIIDAERGDDAPAA